MANDPRARALTEAHKLVQIGIGESYAARVLELFGMLDFTALGPSAAPWAYETYALMHEGYLVSGEASANYLAEFRRAEAGITDAPIVRPRMGSTHIVDELMNLTDDMQALLEAGYSVSFASEQGRARLEAYAQRAVLNGGRNTIRASAKRNTRATGWRRVSDGQPCAFCAMLVGRGPVYKTETVGFRAHGFCGCTAEEYYGPIDDWEPTGQEQVWRDAYFEAAEQADAAGQTRVAPKKGNGEDHILWRMRRNRPALFSDGVTVEP